MRQRKTPRTQGSEGLWKYELSSLAAGLHKVLDLEERHTELIGDEEDGFEVGQERVRLGKFLLGQEVGHVNSSASIDHDFLLEWRKRGAYPAPRSLLFGHNVPRLHV